MRLVTFSNEQGLDKAGALIESDSLVVDLQQAALSAGQPHLAFSSVLTLVETGDEALQAAAALVRQAPTDAVLVRDDVRLKAPIQPPPQMRDCSCFELHLQQCYEAARRAKAARSADPAAALREMDTSEDDKVIEAFRRQPIYYKCNRFAVVGPDDDVLWPSYSRLMDFELELACYIGKQGRDISRDKAREHIVGFTIFNDMSARDEQGREMPGKLGPAKGKDFDTGNVMGPCLVTMDEIEDPYDLTMIARVNGEEWGRGNTRDMLWRFEDVIAHISRSETLYPGEVLGSGTVGNGCGLEQLRYLKPNDVVELEIEQIGTLATRIVKPES
ncbi:fumarylacetoacetate hydrolase family protein [Pseudomaricurvus alkylphenolicus]|uniref:fumarylacetoacetate hydrolase family protein n=1 Tax=Pseudomaricurvus alkylphenolicus TaxID=1306991 RepID=UPI0014247C07|nr:fumarylacetoacetate hydrolase family protein [Pseudomaricurvus alkylphenolicus]